jgi:hypothetical protein
VARPQRADCLSGKSRSMSLTSQRVTPEISAKTRAPKIEFVEPIQTDFTRPDLTRKIFRFSSAPNGVFLRGIPPHGEGRTRRHDTWSAGCDGRDMSRDERHDADGEVVWSWRPDAGAKLAENDPLMTVAKEPGHRAGHRGEHEISRKAIAQGMSECFGEPVVANSCVYFVSHTRLWVRRAPGIPCALIEGDGKSKTRADHAARMQSCILQARPSRARSALLSCAQQR